MDIGNLALSTYLPSMSANTWYTVDIPLSALGATSTLTGISAMRSTTGTLYFDEIKLLGVATSTATTTYAYDATGQRIMKGLNATTTYQYVNAGAEQVLVERDMASSTLSTYFVYGTNLISEGPAATSSREYYITDGLGNVRYITNSSGNSMGGYTYQPFGTITTGSATTTTHAFQTEQKDPESNLIYLRARYYDPTTARFTARDPFSGFMVDPASQNGYNYVQNNPVNLSDPSGNAALLAVPVYYGVITAPEWVPIVAAGVVATGALITADIALRNRGLQWGGQVQTIDPATMGFGEPPMGPEDWRPNLDNKPPWMKVVAAVSLASAAIAEFAKPLYEAYIANNNQTPQEPNTCAVGSL